ncbi:hypothetical protein [Armatimonas rosea]|uniref:Uncharacterized protein n=1 Tax=Armatimonas rosea TaxID=685828 RepID=A0A7W9SRU7_ARMRO|nr:hypothetical protein [Armatimonas rosea]MBB6050908.1 hypothetical protein [Armatimonas rosea]
MALPLFVPALVCAATVHVQSFSGDYTGKQDGGTIKLTLKQESDGSVTGTFNDGSSMASLAGTVASDGKKITGQFTYQGINLPFEIRRKGAGIEFVMKLGNEEEVMGLSRTGGTVPPDAPEPTKPKPAKPPATKPSAVPKPSAAPTLAGAYVHPAGLKIGLPQGWKVQAYGPVLALLPPGATKADGDELYLLLVGEANGISSKTDPRLGQFLELILNGAGGDGGLLLGKGVTFQRTGQDGNGLTFQGGNGRGASLYARCLFSEPKGRIAAVLALGLKAKIAPREAALQGALAAVSASTPERDSRLLGSWKGTTSTKSRDARDAAGRQQASSVTDSSTTYQLTGDGRFVESRWSRTIAIGQGVSLDSGDTVERTQGLWAASNGKIAFCEDNGLYLLGSYQVQGGGVVIQIGDRVITLSHG